MDIREELIKDINAVFKLAMESDQLGTALKAKELVAKLTCLSKQADKMNLKCLTNEDLDEIIKSLDGDV